MDAKQLYEEGRLNDAIEAALADVKRHPTDMAKRSLLCELLCFSGEFERADKQLDFISTQDTSTAVGVTVWRGLIRAAIARNQFYEQGRVPEFLQDPSPRIQDGLKASIMVREGNHDEAAELLQKNAAEGFEIKGTCDGTPFSEFRDWDDVSQDVFEILTTSGKFFWVPVSDMISIEFHPLGALRDLIWRPAHISVHGNPDGEVYFPVLYPGSEKSDDDDIRLSRVTDWREDSGLNRGIGVRMFQIGDDSKQILQLTKLTFDQ